MNFYIPAIMVALTIAARQVEPNNPPAVGLRCFATLLGCVLVGLASATNVYFSLWALSRRPADEFRIITRLQLRAAVRRILSILIFASTLFVIGWPGVVLHSWGLSKVFLVRDLLIALPFLLGEFLALLPANALNRAVFKLRQGNDPERLGVYPASRIFWSSIREVHGLCLGFLLITIFSNDVLDWFFAGRKDSLLGIIVLQGLSMLGLGILMPLLLRSIWTTEPIPAGPMKDVMKELCKRAGVLLGDIRIWHSSRPMANAAMIGLVPPFRFIFMTDLLMHEAEPRELVGVFGHELGHARYLHVPLFMCFLAVSQPLLISGTELLYGSLDRNLPDFLRPVMENALTMLFLELTLVGAYVFFVFGWLSRLCERQADVYGCVIAGVGTALVEGNQVGGHTSKRASARSVDDFVFRRGVDSYTRALERVGAINGIDLYKFGWRHGSLMSRIRFLEKIADRVAERKVFDRRTALKAWGVVGILAVLSAGQTLATFFLK